MKKIMTVMLAIIYYDRYNQRYGRRTGICL